MRFLCTLIDLYILVIFARIIFSFLDIPSDHPVGRLRNALAAIVDPVLAPIRRVIPPVRLGAAALDLSPIVLFFALGILRNIIC